MHHEIFARHFYFEVTFGTKKSVLVGYTDSNRARDLHNRKFTSDYLITFAGGVAS